VLKNSKLLCRNIPLKLGLGDYSGYTAPQNLEALGPNYLYYGFIPAYKARSRTKQGLQVGLRIICVSSLF